MANCPNCGSEHIQLIRETNVSWGRAVAGWALFGVVGGAVGAVTGKDKNVNSCLDCGTSWEAADLHKILKNVESLTGLNLNLSNKDDRETLNYIIEWDIDNLRQNLQDIKNLRLFRLEYA
jgi:hypothetical protein